MYGKKLQHPFGKKGEGMDKEKSMAKRKMFLNSNNMKVLSRNF